MSGKDQAFAGVDVGGTKVFAVVVTGEGEVIGRAKEPTRQDGTPLAEQIAVVVEGAVADAGLKLAEVAGIGVGVPGVVDSRTGRFVKAPNLEIDDHDLILRLREKYDIPVHIGNDVNLGTLAEVWLGAGRGAQTVVGIFVGTGIGGGVVVDGKLLAGPEDLAGEIGHLVLMVDGPVCGCGNLGCFEALASRTAIERDLRQALAEGRESRIMEFARDGQIKSGALQNALEAGDELVTEVLRRAGHYLGQGVLTIRHLLDPELIILGGGVVEACGDFLMPLIEAEVRGDNMKGSRDELRLVRSALRDDAVALGAAALARAQVTGTGPAQIAGAPAEAQAETPAEAPAQAAEEETVEYPVLGKVSFGAVVVDGKEASYDIYIRADGKVAKRKKKAARSKYGTSHVVDREELERVCKGNPRVVIIGNGHHGMLRLSEDAREYLEWLGVEWQVLKTPEAVAAYNQAPGPKALLLHVTC